MPVHSPIVEYQKSVDAKNASQKADVALQSFDALKKLIDRVNALEKSQDFLRERIEALEATDMIPGTPFSG